MTSKPIKSTNCFFFQQYKITKPIRKIHSWGRRPGEILLSSAGQSRKSCRQPKPSKSQHTSQPRRSQKYPKVRDNTIQYNTIQYNTIQYNTTQPIGSTKQHKLPGKSIPEGGRLGEILLSSAGLSRKSCHQPKLNKSQHTSQPLIHRSLILQISLNYFVTQGAFSKHTLYIDSTSYPLGNLLLGETTRRHPPVVSSADQEIL